MASIEDRNARVAATISAATHAALYISAPTAVAAGTEVVGGSPAYARKVLAWAPPSNGASTATVTFDVPVGTLPAGAGLHTAATGGLFRDGGPLSAGLFTAQGQLSVTFTITEQ